MHVGDVKCSEKLTAKASAGFTVRRFGSLRSPTFGGFASSLRALVVWEC